MPGLPEGGPQQAAGIGYDSAPSGVATVQDPQEHRAQDESASTEQQDRTVPKHHVTRLIKLAKNFDKAVENLPRDKQEQFAREQREVAETKRRAQMSEGVLRMRVR